MGSEMCIRDSGGNKVVLESTDTVTVDSDTNNSIDATLTIMEIT